MFTSLPPDAFAVQRMDWQQLDAYYAELLAHPLTPDTFEAWLEQWSQLTALVIEAFARLMIASSKDMTDADASTRRGAFQREIMQPQHTRAQALTEKLLASGLSVPQHDTLLRVLRARAASYVEANQSLGSQEYELLSEYDTLTGAQQITVHGETLGAPGLSSHLMQADRAGREALFRQMLARQLADRAQINRLWTALQQTRVRMAANAGLPDYRALWWRENLRWDFSPQDAETLHAAIAEVAVPAASRIYARYRAQLGVDTLRPWDFSTNWYAYPAGSSAADAPQFRDGADLAAKCAVLFRQLDPTLGAYFQTMIDEALLDLDPRPGKMPGGNQLGLAVVRRPHITGTVTGVGRDVRLLLHESGHAFTTFESAQVPFLHIINSLPGLTELPSVTMELIAGELVGLPEVGLYAPDAARHAQIAYLEELLLWLPHLALEDAFDHWVYTHPQDAADPAACDAQWAALVRRFRPDVDWSGLESELATGWQRAFYPFWMPFFTIEYALALLGAVHLWAQFRADYAAGMATYRRMLALLGARPLPEVFAVMGARFAFDVDAVRACVAALETRLVELGA